MNGKQAKKLRQIVRKDYQKQIEEMAKIFSNYMKPKPRWVPLFIWVKLLRIFIKIK